MRHAFLYISLPSLHDYNVKVLKSRFVEDGNTRQQLSFSFPELWYSPLKFNFKNISANIWRNKRDGISAIKFEAARIHFLSDVFAAVARRCCLSSLISNDLLLQNCRCFRPARILMRLVIIYRWFSAQKLPVKSYLGYTYKQQMWATEKLCIGQEFTIKYVTSHAKTYTDGFPFSNGFPFTSRLSVVRTAWLPVS